MIKIFLTVVITIVVYTITMILALVVIGAHKQDSNEDDQEQLDYLAHYNSTRKGGTKDGNKTEKPEDSQG